MVRKNNESLTAVTVASSRIPSGLHFIIIRYDSTVKYDIEYGINFRKGRR